MQANILNVFILPPAQRVCSVLCLSVVFTCRVAEHFMYNADVHNTVNSFLVFKKADIY